MNATETNFRLTIEHQRRSREEMLAVISPLLDTDHLGNDALQKLTQIFEEHRQTSNLLALVLPARVLGTIPVLAPPPFCTAAESAGQN